MSLKGTFCEKIVPEVFGGKTACVNTCSNCQYTRFSEDDFVNISVEV